MLLVSAVQRGGFVYRGQLVRLLLPCAAGASRFARAGSREASDRAAHHVLTSARTVVTAVAGCGGVGHVAQAASTGGVGGALITFDGVGLGLLLLLFEQLMLLLVGRVTRRRTEVSRATTSTVNHLLVLMVSGSRLGLLLRFGWTTTRR